jgi:hypothetical protein
MMDESQPIRMHWLSIFGIWLFCIGVFSLFAAMMFLTSELPSTPDRNSLDLAQYTEDLASAVRQIKMRGFLMWLGDYLLAGGFFAWLAGISIREIEKAIAKN